MREDRRGMRDEGWGPSPRPGGPEWGSRSGRGSGRHGGERGERGDREFRGGPAGPRWGSPDALRRGGPGGPGFRPPFGPGGPGGPFAESLSDLADEAGFGRHGRGRGPRARKGDVRAAILDLFAEEAGRTWNGYQLIQEIPARTDGAWRPSAGSVYPALQQLVDEGLIAPEGTGRRRVYTLTDQGRAYVEAHADELRSSWDSAAGVTDEDAIEFRNLIRQVMMAVMEVRRAGSADQVAQARAVLAQARKSLYLILAQDAPETGATGAEPASAPPADNDTADADTDTAEPADTPEYGA
jgi:DNA-binding PadR family transcriptional regulator